MLVYFIDISKFRIKKLKRKLKTLFPQNKGIRTLRKEAINPTNIVSVFDSILTRTLKMKQNKLYDNIFIVQTYYFEILKDIIINGFYYNDELYIPLTASAGQIRTKKTVFIKEKIWKKYQNTLTCGLTVEDINLKGGVNINKYLAYLALCNSATDEWIEFDIDKSIVVDDLETLVEGEVDFIDDETYEITRKIMQVPINHTDGAGMYLPSMNNKNMMIRLPWIKGLMISFPFDTFIKEHKNSTTKIKDIYGKEWDIIKDDIQIIFTKSQFKMWKYYSSWDEYKKKYKKYKCQAGKTNEEEDEIGNAKIGYQMLQSLSDMKDKEIKKIISKTKYNIESLSNNKNTMLKVLGVTKFNLNKNYFQQALELYPNLLRDIHCKEVLKEVKKSIVKDAKGARIDILGKYTFISPDMYAFCEYLFLGEKNPKGLLQNGEVYCSLFPDKKELDCLRSPSLYREHPVRNNVVDDKKGKWFITKALYTSVHDLISKVLQFDVDGDKSLVVADTTLIEVAKRNMQGIVPLYYNMKKAEPSIISRETIYEGLENAYSGGNIGMISNNITKIWNSDNINLDVIKWQCMENNYVIDYAKTLYKPKRPKKMNELISEYTKLKVPYFFIYAKDKDIKNVEKPNNSLINRLSKMIPNPTINFISAGIEEFDYRLLMKNPKVTMDMKIIDRYCELDLKKYFISNKKVDEDSSNINYLYQNIKKELLKLNNDIYYVTDVLIYYLYKIKHSRHKTTLWECFGDIIVENLRNNLKNEIYYCNVCGIPIEKTTNNKIYCDSCAREIQLEWQRESMNKIRNKM
jgi:arsenate reductase-like glutaredoxin family protein